MFRQVIRPETKSDLTIHLPEKYLGKEVEIAASEIKKSKRAKNSKKEKNRQQNVKEMFNLFDKHLVSLKNFKFNREEANER